MKIRGCIFDLDGVIVDTAKYHFMAWNRLARELGHELTEEDNEKLKGVSRMESLEIILKNFGLEYDDETKVKLAEKKNNWYVEYIKNMDSSEILSGVIDFLNTLRENNIKIGLASASKNAMTVLRSIKLADSFDVIIDGNKITKAKPDPEIFLKAAEGLNLSPQECIVFEDAVAGIEAAKRANMKSVGVGEKEKLRDADKVISGFEGIDLSILEF